MNEDEKNIEAEENLKKTLRLALTPEAYSRLINVSIANPELFKLASNTIINMFVRYGKKINEEQLIQILKKLKGDGGEGSIIIRRK